MAPIKKTLFNRMSRKGIAQYCKEEYKDILKKLKLKWNRVKCANELHTEQLLGTNRLPRKTSWTTSLAHNAKQVNIILSNLLTARKQQSA